MSSSNIVLSKDILAPFLGNMCSSFSMSDMNLMDQVCDAATAEKVAATMEELQMHPWFLPTAAMYSLLTRILGWSAVAAVFLLMIGGIEVKLFSDEEMMDEDDEDENEKYKKLFTRRK
jgi:hypothetical protein